MNKFALLLLTSTLAMGSMSFAGEVGIVESQNSADAVRYFEHELSFTTNPYRVKSEIDAKNQNIIVVDVRLEDDFKAGHIPGAVSIPFNKYSEFSGSEKEFPGLNKNKMHYIYCYTPYCNLAQKAAKKFASLGYRVKEMKGGIQAWKEFNFPVEK